MSIYRRRPAKDRPAYAKPPARPRHSIPVFPRRPQKPAGPRPQTKALNHGAPDGFHKMKPELFAGQGAPATPFSLYAVVGTWREADVVAACVKSLFANGVQKVFLVDNESPDDTVARAVAAGAKLAATFKTPYYDDDVRLRTMNEVMRHVTETEKLDALWWLSLDADEFPCGPRGENLAGWLQTLPDEIDCVGCDSFDLYPEAPDWFDPLRHPAEVMARGMLRREYRNIYCDRSHWKHPLLKQRKGRYALAQSRGSHVPFASGVTPREPGESLTLFHAPLRRPEDSRARLAALCGADPALGGRSRMATDDQVTGNNGAGKRWASLEAVYAGRWSEVDVPHSQCYGTITGVALYAWRRVLKFQDFPRWYAPPPVAPLSTPGLVILQ